MNVSDLPIFGLLAFVAVALVVRYVSERRRSKALRLQAKELGLSFEKWGGANTEERLAGFQLFSHYGERMRNRMWGRRNGSEVMIFDYESSVGFQSGLQKQSVLFLESNGMNLPRFELRPMNLFHKIGRSLGRQGIDFEVYPVFSSAYLLHGPDETCIRRVFTHNVLSFLERHKGLCIDGQGDILVCYRRYKLVKPDEVKPFLENGEFIQQLLLSA